MNKVHKISQWIRVAIFATLIFNIGTIHCCAKEMIRWAVVDSDGSTNMYSKPKIDKRKCNEKCMWQTVTLDGIVHISPYSKF